MTREEALIKTLEIYAETDKQVSQDFYQSLCKAALRSIKNKLLESKLDSTDFTKFRQQIGKALNMKGLLDEDIPPTEFILAEIDRLTAENKELNTEREWWENLTRKGNIGTKDVPSLHDYIVKLQAELKTTKDELKYCQRLLDIESRP